MVQVRTGIVTVGVILLTTGILLMLASLNAHTITSNYQYPYDYTVEIPADIPIIAETITIPPSGYYNYTLTYDPAILNGSKLAGVSGSYNASNGPVRVVVFDRMNFNIWAEGGTLTPYAETPISQSGEFAFSPYECLQEGCILVFDNVHTPDPNTVKEVQVWVNLTVLQQVPQTPDYQQSETRIWTGAPMLSLGALMSICGFVTMLAGLAATPPTPLQVQHQYPCPPPHTDNVESKLCPYCHSRNDQRENFCKTCGERLT